MWAALSCLYLLDGKNSPHSRCLAHADSPGGSWFDSGFIFCAQDSGVTRGYQTAVFIYRLTR